MSRRHHGHPHHSARRPEPPRPVGNESRPVVLRDDGHGGPAPSPGTAGPASSPLRSAEAVQARPQSQIPTVRDPALRNGDATVRNPAAHNGNPAAHNGNPAAPASPPSATASHALNGHADRGNMCTAPQLRRFIKSRPYVPMHELRRRFAIDGGDDIVTGVLMSSGQIYVGLPLREGRLLGELLRAGEVGYELSMDPRTPVVIGVYPMRPVPRS